MKKAGITGIPAGKKKDKTFFCFCNKNKDTFFFRSYKNIQKVKRSLTKILFISFDQAGPCRPPA